jgi:hypothetical protein
MRAQVDVYSFSMIAYQLFELQPPFAGMDPVDAARKAALAEERPALVRLNAGTPTMKVRGLPNQAPCLVRGCLIRHPGWSPLLCCKGWAPGVTAVPALLHVQGCWAASLHCALWQSGVAHACLLCGLGHQACTCTCMS